ncbi:MAG: uracil phosphoribosyltransferase [Pseudohongiellaceae bacterium]|jgi:uracil phosphoribosyltransferase
MTAEHPNLRLIEHPLIAHKLTQARHRETPTSNFRRLLHEISSLMTYEVCRDLPLREITVPTPLEDTTGHELALPLTLVPILRAGMGLTEGILALIPEARVGFIGLYRDEQTIQPVTYYTNLPQDIGAGTALVIDPMLASGGSASRAISILKDHGCDRIRVVVLVAAPEGLAALQADHPEIVVYAASLDRELDANSYIRPGLGDAGDRIFGTD